MPEKLKPGIPLPFRQAYLSQMYPSLTKDLLRSKVRSEQQLEVFCKYYGLECEPQTTQQIQSDLRINSHNQIAVQVERVETKLGVDKDERSKLVKQYRKEYYKQCRPKCPYCKRSQAQYRGVEDSDIRWTCGRCKRGFKTPNVGETAGLRVDIKFLVEEPGKVSQLRLTVDGKRKEPGEKLQLMLPLAIRTEEWIQPNSDEVAPHNLFAKNDL